jgi:membrane-bound metal-dependent hydrolase YbcI (DUF457 family)
MLISAGVMRLFLGLGVMVMALMAIFYLRQRRMPFHEYLAWGLMAIFMPVFGPFWVIYMRPGQPAWPRRHALTRQPNGIGRRRRTLLDWSKKWVTGR